MSESMVERVALEVGAKLNDLPFSQRTVPAIVRLVIEAMREPTEGMVIIGKNVKDSDNRPTRIYWTDDETIIGIWEDMIDEALK